MITTIVIFCHQLDGFNFVFFLFRLIRDLFVLFFKLMMICLFIRQSKRNR